jgi:multiple sugar transport system substrate-binding protein
MVGRPTGTGALGRRRLLKSSTAALALAALAGRSVRAAGTPWADQPAARVDRLNFVVWTYGDIYTKISKKFADDWGVPVDATISSFNDHPTKLMTMYAGGETVDVSQSSPFSFPNFITQGSSSRLTACPAPTNTRGTSPNRQSRSRWSTAS